MNKETRRRRAGISPAAFERVLDGIRDGRTLTSICSDRGIPNRRNVLRYLANNPEHEERMLRARRLGVWSQLDGLVDRFLGAEPQELARIKELANHIRWLAGKLSVEPSSGLNVSQRDVIEVRWLDGGEAAPDQSDGGI